METPRHRQTLEVAFGDTDASGWMYFPNIFRYFEMAEHAYLRSIWLLDDQRIQTASAVEPGHVLRIMRAGDMIGTTQRDLAGARERVGGEVAAFIAFSCLNRHWEASADNLERELAACYGELPTIGFSTFGEQSGMLFVNHTLTGIAIGGMK